MTNEKKITKRDNFTEIATLLETAGRADLAAVINHEIELLDKKAATAKATAAKRKAEGDSLTEAVAAALTEEFAFIADIVDRVEAEDVTIHKVQYRLNKLVEAGVATKTQLTVPATEGGKARKLTAFALATAEN